MISLRNDERIDATVKYWNRLKVLFVIDYDETIVKLIDLIYFKNHVGGIKDNNDRAVLCWTSNKTIHYNNGVLFVIEFKLFC